MIARILFCIVVEMFLDTFVAEEYGLIVTHLFIPFCTAVEIAGGSVSHCSSVG